MFHILTGSKPKQSPPPPYSPHQPASPLILAETTTTEVVTTTTTRLLISPRRQRQDEEAESHNVAMSAPSPLARDKDLPPTPSETIHPFPSAQQPIRHSDARPRTAPSLDVTAAEQPPRSPTTHALAHASLGLGFPHSIPRASTSTSPAITFSVSSPSSDNVQPEPTRTLVNQRSMHNLRAQPSSPQSSPGTTAAQQISRRSRGISFGPNSFFGFGNSEVNKPKAAQEHADSAPPPARPLARKSSFWSRKKTKSTTDVPHIVGDGLERTAASAAGPTPVLPGFPPSSPFNMDIPPSSPSRHKRGLSRSNSERVCSAPIRPQASEPVPIVQPPRSSFRRPSTADSSAAPRETTTNLIPFLSPDSSPSSSRRPTTSDSSVTRGLARSVFLTSSSHPVLESSSPEPLVTRLSGDIGSAPSEASAVRRPRSSTNPPLLNRLSISLFSSPSLPQRMHQESTRSSLSSSSPIVESSRPSLQRPSAVVPKPSPPDETPEVYVVRLRGAVSKGEVAGILASSADPFYVRSLGVYMKEFEFSDLPLDVALRKLLMDAGLPRETQQIDRVIETFAARYTECNPGLFSSDDHPYILAFSLIMLHTDNFNKSNKRKMTKADYIRNTRLPGVIYEVLDYFYDNIVFTPFIYVEDPYDVNGQPGFSSPLERRSQGSASRALLTHPSDSTVATSGGILSKSARLDPYYLISQDLLGPLRVDVAQHLPLDNPYSCKGTAAVWDEEQLRSSFTEAIVIEVMNHQTSTSPFFAYASGASASVIGDVAMASPPLVPPSNHFILKVTKVGVLDRKDDILPGGKKSTSRRWRSWSVVLTGSQLLLFRDPTWASFFTDQLKGRHAVPGTPRFDITMFRPDELISMKDAVAVYDQTYKHPHTFRLAKADGRHILFKSVDDEDMNSWLARLNYASAFKSAGVRMRSPRMSPHDVRLTGIAAATSHLHDMQVKTSTARSQSWDSNSPKDLMDMLSSSLSAPADQDSVRSLSQDSDIPRAPEVEGAAQFAQTFDQVKAELATGRWSEPRNPNSSTTDQIQPLPSQNSTHPLSSRSHFIACKVSDSEASLSASQVQLDTYMRAVRNISILTPFQKATQDRLVSFVQSMSSQIMKTRLEIVRLACQRETLKLDMEAEQRDSLQSKEMALKIATETLQAHLGKDPSTTVAPDDEDLQDGRPSTLQRPSGSLRHEPSICESFHSALDFSSDWPAGLDDADTPVLLSANRTADADSSVTSLNSKETKEAALSHPAPPTDSAHEKFFTAAEGIDEEAEEWDKTRCAQRVSLVRWPSGHRISTLLQHYVRSQDNDSLHSLHEEDRGQSASPHGPRPPDL